MQSSTFNFTIFINVTFNFTISIYVAVVPTIAVGKLLMTLKRLIQGKTRSLCQAFAKFRPTAFNFHYPFVIDHIHKDDSKLCKSDLVKSMFK